MSSFLIKERLQQVLVNELTARLPARKFVMGRRDSADTGPMGVVKVDRVDEILPDTGVYEAEVAIVLVRNMDEEPPPGLTNAQDQSAFAREVEQALNQIPRPGYDDEVGIVLNGWVTDQIAEASDKQDYADILFLTVGCQILERADGIPTGQVPVG